MQEKTARALLILGGVFNCVMGGIFFSDRLLRLFFELSARADSALFSSGGGGRLVFPQDPVHLMFIHGFGSAALILGAVLIAASRDIPRYLPFIFIDALGRLLYGSTMVYYVFRYSLMHLILAFACLELFFAIAYLVISRRRRGGQAG